MPLMAFIPSAACRERRDKLLWADFESEYIPLTDGGVSKSRVSAVNDTFPLYGVITTDRVPGGRPHQANTQTPAAAFACPLRRDSPHRVTRADRRCKRGVAKGGHGAAVDATMKASSTRRLGHARDL